MEKLLPLENASIVDYAPVFDNKILKLTHEQAAIISTGNKEAYNKFFLDNYDLFRNIAWRWIHKNTEVFKYKYFYLVDEIVDELYIDLFEYCEFMRGVRWLLYFIKRRCLWAIRHGGLYHLKENSYSQFCAIDAGHYIQFFSLDAPTRGSVDGKTLGEWLPFVYRKEDLYNKVRIEIMMSVFSEYLTPVQHVVIASCLSGTSWQYVNELLGKDGKCKSSIDYLLYACKKIVSNWDDISEKLKLKGINLKLKKTFTLAELPCFIKTQKRVSDRTSRRQNCIENPEQKAARLEKNKLWREANKERIAAQRKAARNANIEEARRKDRERKQRQLARENGT